MQLEEFIFTHIMLKCGCTQSPLLSEQTQINTPTPKHNHMHQLTRFMTFEKGGQLCFHHQSPNQLERKTKPEEHMVLRAVMDGGVMHEIEAKRL